MKLNLLAFETSSSRCGVALLRDAGDGSPQVAQLEHEGAQEHAERLLPMAGELLASAGLAPADLDAVAFGQGPGGFTGLRVACGVAQGVALGLGVPVLPVVSHLAVAEDAEAGPDEAVLVALDARMAEVYLAAYAWEPASAGAPAWRVLQAPMLIAAEEVLPWAMHALPAWSRESGRELSLRLAGDAWQAYPEAMPTAGLRQAPLGRPRAATVARLARQGWQRGEALPPEEAAPLYVRDKVAFTTAERVGGLGGNPRAGRALPAEPSVLPPGRSQGKNGPLGGQQAQGAAWEPVLLQAMTRDDLDDVTALEAQVQDFPWTRGNFEDALASGYPACVLRHGARLAGFCVLMQAPDVTHLLVIAVTGDLQRHGLGRRLVDWCQAQAARSGAEGIVLEVRPSNGNARRFYERLGFRQIGARKGYYPAAKGREDALVLRRDVAPGQGGASTQNHAMPGGSA